MDISESCERIRRFTEILSFGEFVRSDPQYDAVIRNLLVIGEAVKQLPEEIRAMDEQIQWKKNAGLRDIVAHVYFGIDDDIVWDVVQNKVPELTKSVEAILDDLR